MKSLSPLRSAALLLAIPALLASCATKPGQQFKETGEALRGIFDGTTTDALSVDLRVEPAGEQVAVVATIRNESDMTLFGDLHWHRNGSMQGEAVPFDNLAPGATVEERLMLDRHTGETAVLAEVFFNGMAQDRERIRLFGQEMTSKPPVIDGKLDDWNDPAVIKIWPAKHQLIPSREAQPLTNGDFSGEMRVLWTDSHLFVGADIVDATPRLNAQTGPYIWMGDSIEVYVGFPGPTTQASLSKGYIQLGISPGNDGANPASWNYLTASPVEGIEIASERTANGYAIETAIPLASLGATVKPGQILAFTTHLNNRTSETAEGADQVLVWNGDRNNWQNPSLWGAAMILPDPANAPKPAPGRVQLFGGNTVLKISETATKDPAFLTPLPVEHAQKGAYLPDWLELSIPYQGTFEVSGGYGFENAGWTHQTIANAGSANDFFALDIATPTGTPVLAAAPGRVVTAGRRGDSYGNYVVIDHGRGYHTIYAHLDTLEFQVDKGEPEIAIKRGDLIGHSGSTGTRWPHLHFAVHKDTRVSHSGADVGGLTVVPEPLGGFYGIRKGHVLGGE